MTLVDDLCYFLNYNYVKFQHILPIYHSEDVPNFKSHDAQSSIEFNRAQLEWDFYKNFLASLENKSVLDIGCGFGGKSVFYALKTAKVIGIDIKLDKFPVATNFAKLHEVEGKVEFHMADAASLPFDTNSFDLVMSNNTMHYLAQPLKSLQECKRVVKPGGLICINFGPPWHAPFAPETGVCFPWTHLLFSQDTIRKTFMRMGRGNSLRDSNGDIFKYNNKMTIKRFRKLLSLANLDLLYFKLWTRPFMAPLIYVPFIKEYFCAQVISISQKDNSFSRNVVNHI